MRKAPPQRTSMIVRERNMIVRKVGGWFAALGWTLLLLSAAGAHGAVERLEGKAVRTLTTGDGRFGGCMVQLNKRFAETGLNCPGSWVTFSCTGVHTSKEDGSRMFDSAQMAFSLDKTIVVEVDDGKKHNGHCYARRVDVKKN